MSAPRIWTRDRERIVVAGRSCVRCLPMANCDSYDSSCVLASAHADGACRRRHGRLFGRSAAYVG